MPADADWLPARHSARAEPLATGPGAIAHEERTLQIASLLDRQVLEAGEPCACPYLKGKVARFSAVLPSPLSPGLYHSLMDLNFRRVGRVFYRTSCEGCSECRMIRVPVEGFRPSRAQTRCIRRNRDLEIEVGPPTPSEEKHRLYARYLDARHDGQMDGSKQEFHDFLYSSPLRGLEVVARLGGRIASVGVADVEPEAVSAVYSYFDPELERRSLGVLSILKLIEECVRRRKPYLYLGFFVAGARTMRYKSAYRPCEVLGTDGAWRRFEPGEGSGREQSDP